MSYKPPAKCWCGWPRDAACHAMHPQFNPQCVDNYHCWLKEHLGPDKQYVEVQELIKLIKVVRNA